MFQVLRVNHTIHLVADLDALDKWYANVFSPMCPMKGGYLDTEKRDASSFVFSDYSVETMAPAHVEGAEKLPVGRFLTRFGQHFYSFGLHVTDLPSLFQTLRDHNVRIYGNGGLPLQEFPGPGYTLYTHPLDTCSLFEISDPATRGVRSGGGVDTDPRSKSGWSTAYWRDGHPLGIERTSHYTVVVRDLERAKTLYEDVLRCKLIHEGENAANKTQSAYFLVGEESVVELAKPTSTDSLAAWDLETNGEFMHAVTFKVKDIDRAESHLTGKGLRIENRQVDSFVLNRDDALGAVYAFTQTSIPNDPRSK